MALSRISANTANILSNRLGNENKMPGKGPIASKGGARTTRAAVPLGDIGNKVSNVLADHTKKGISKKDVQVTKPSKGLTKSKATTSLKQVAQNDVKPKQRTMSPMDVSSAYSKALVEDIDLDDKDNPQLVAEYVNDIYEYMRTLERQQCVRANYLEGQEVTSRMRGILVDWLVQVHSRFHLLQETLYLTVAIIDRFLQVQEVSRSKLQLVGVTAMLVASKYEEMYAPEIADFVYITDNAYSKSDIRKMEILILKTLEFNLGRPLPLHFLRRNSKAGQVDAGVHTLAKYLMEITITEYDMVQYHPSQIAGAALCLAMKVLENGEWSDTLAHYSAYSEKDLLPIMKKMAALVTKSDKAKLKAIKTKYSSSKFMKISTSPELHSTVIADLAAGAS